MNQVNLLDDATAVVVLRRRSGDVLRCLVSPSSLPVISQYHWCGQYNPLTNSFYAISSTGGKRKYMHRVVTDCPATLVPDHANHDTLDNRLGNLIVGTRRRNNLNTKRTTVAKRVYRRRDGAWYAQIRVNGSLIHLGCAPTEGAAAALVGKYVDGLPDADAYMGLR